MKIAKGLLLGFGIATTALTTVDFNQEQKETTLNSQVIELSETLKTDYQVNQFCATGAALVLKMQFGQAKQYEVKNSACIDRIVQVYQNNLDAIYNN